MEGRRSAIVFGLVIVLLIGLVDVNLATGDYKVEDDADRKVEETTQDAQDQSARTWGDAAKDWARTVTDFSSKESGKAHESIKDTSSKVVDKGADAANEGNHYVNDILRQAMDQLVAVKEKIAKIVSDTQEKLYEAFESGKGTVQQKGSESINHAKDLSDVSKDEVSGRAREGTEGLRQKASEVAENLKDAAGTLSDKVTGGAEDATGSAQGLFHSTRETLPPKADLTKETLKSAKGTAAERAQVKEESVQDKASKVASELGDKIKQTVSGQQQSADRQEL
ncbi:hypothetical protein O6H91_02G138600 [Diphasiastrum complanatum]|uniref:Uncharacterized protein n=1 Tax=Diphasiastrum complanatum TaxID=34168 RepID=A0ACC2ELD0_DIPCM|nr:hypothetical protein O6H91_02G138600 [Diphasiastrum complanatum]